MTRAKRVALWSAIIIITYFVTLFAYIPVPFLAEEHAEQILPVVCHLLHFSSPPSTLTLSSRPVTMVAANFVWLVRTLVARTWPLRVP
jgi:hypothetical protein